MAARKLAQEVDKCFKKVIEGIAEFDAIYEKTEQATNQAQKEKLEDQLKREIKKLQRLRDQIKTWAASNDIKDKAPLLENRRTIETRMEKFKAIEKAMKTKAYSKEGLSAAAVLDPKEQAKIDASDFLSTMVEELEQQIEKMETESESIQSTAKKGKVTGAKAERLSVINRVLERHKWHQGKMELIRRSLENGGVEADQVTDLEESIRFYVSDGAQDETMIDDDTLYDDLNLDENEDQFGLTQDNERGSSQDAESVHDDAKEGETKASLPNNKIRTGSEPLTGANGRRPSSQLKSPLPVLAVLHPPSLPTASSTAAAQAKDNLKPSTVPIRPPGEGLKYASAAAAAALHDKNGIGIGPLPPPPGAPAVIPASTAASHTKPAVAASPSPISAQAVPASVAQPPETKAAAPAQPSIPGPSTAPSARLENVSKAIPTRAASRAPAAPEPAEVAQTPPSAPAPLVNGAANGVKSAAPPVEEKPVEEESYYHLPASLQDLVEALEVTKNKPLASVHSPSSQRMLSASRANAPDISDLEAPRRYHPEEYCAAPATYPREVHNVFDNSQVYSRIDQDTLFYAFYYRQGSYQQYLAAKALKEQSWRFHKQYQTWFQRHEEPKNITEEFEQGTYRFFDYESTWMNRRKADFKFAYKFLEDEI